jgi:hypothetical protein
VAKAKKSTLTFDVLLYKFKRTVEEAATMPIAGSGDEHRNLLP